MRKVRLSAAVTLVLIGGAGCRDASQQVQTAAQGDTPAQRAERDEVPVSETPREGFHFSPFYGGYVPFIVPIGGFGGGMSYRNRYSSLPPHEQAAYPPPRSGSFTGSSTRPGTTTTPSRGGFGATGRSGFSAGS